MTRLPTSWWLDPSPWSRRSMHSDLLRRRRCRSPWPWWGTSLWMHRYRKQFYLAWAKETPHIKVIKTRFRNWAQSVKYNLEHSWHEIPPWYCLTCWTREVWVRSSLVFIIPVGINELRSMLSSHWWSVLTCLLLTSHPSSQVSLSMTYHNLVLN